MIPKDFTFHILFYMPASSPTTPPSQNYVPPPAGHPVEHPKHAATRWMPGNSASIWGIHDFLLSNLRVLAQQNKNSRKKKLLHIVPPQLPPFLPTPPVAWCRAASSVAWRRSSCARCRESSCGNKSKMMVAHLVDHPRYRKWLGINPPCISHVYSPFWKGKEHPYLGGPTITMVISPLTSPGMILQCRVQRVPKNPKNNRLGLLRWRSSRLFLSENMDRLKPMKITNFLQFGGVVLLKQILQATRSLELEILVLNSNS